MTTLKPLLSMASLQLFLPRVSYKQLQTQISDQLICDFIGKSSKEIDRRDL